MLELDNVIYFDTDDDFYNYAVKPNFVVNQNPNGGISYDMDMTDEYKLAVENGKLFCIKDENSAIYKHGCVSCRTLSKDIQNLEPYFGNFTDKKIAIKTQASENSNGN